jgi:hypothetical protein
VEGDCGEKEMVKPIDFSILPDNLGVELFPPAATNVVMGGIVAMYRDLLVQVRMYLSSKEGQGDRIKDTFQKTEIADADLVILVIESDTYAPL